jgi:hypothetical protein
MNEYERAECYELLKQIIDLDSMLRDNQQEMTGLQDLLKALKEKQLSKYYQVLAAESSGVEE